MNQSAKVLNVWRQACVYFVGPVEGYGHLFPDIRQVVDAMISEQVIRAAEGVRATFAYSFLYDSPEPGELDEEATCRNLEEMLQQRLNI